MCSLRFAVPAIGSITPPTVLCNSGAQVTLSGFFFGSKQGPCSLMPCNLRALLIADWTFWCGFSLVCSSASVVLVLDGRDAPGGWPLARGCVVEA